MSARGSGRAKGVSSRSGLSDRAASAIAKGAQNDFKAWDGTPFELQKKPSETQQTTVPPAQNIRKKNKLWGTSQFRLHEFVFKSTEERRQIILDCMNNGEYRCFFCGRVFFRGTLGPDTNIQIKCHDSKCRHMNVISSV